MSNIPPDPPDPPSTGNEIINQQTREPEPDRSHSSARRGKNGRSDRGRNAAQRSSRRAGHESNSQSDQRHRSSEKSRPRQSARNTTIVEPEAIASEVSSTADRQGQVIDHDRPVNSNTATTSKSRHRSKDNSNRRGQFGARLTHSARPTSSTRSKSPPPDSDLTTRLIHSLKTPPYPDCPICFNPLHPAQPIWCCSLDSNVSSCCWTPFHLKCIKDWAKKSVKDVRDALQTRGVTDELEYWRCPGCQTKRTNVPRGYFCFCGSVTDPKPGVSTPHSCGASCTRRRMACDHPCPLSCHPGPCPPCNLTVYVTCHCGKVTNAVRCENSHPADQAVNSCGAICGRLLQCQIHSCNRPCHPGDCGGCDKFEDITCFCGQTTKEVQCGGGLELAREAYVLDAEHSEIRWSGRFDCGSPCRRAFDCGLHFCSKACHVPSPTPVACPFDPLRVVTCPCGKQLLSDISTTQRLQCTDPIPSCQSICEKRLEGCSHTCAEICHTSSCPPCKALIKVPCRCGLTVRQIRCHEQQKEESERQDPFLCDKVCGALRLCGRHQCSRICCPLGSISRNKPNKSKKKGPSQRSDDHWEDSERIWHTCDLVCGKLLSCGLHRCTEADHRGLCPPCLQSSFEEMICHCGRTIIEPPVPCGTVISCTYPCTRPPPPCGHDKAPHHCHEDAVPCPPCPFLTSKLCSCGKMNVNNVRCSQETVLCGQSCGKLLDCGFHKCKRSCHGDACGPCPSICGKPRKLCHPDNHPCTLPCHAPSICNESEPCTATVTVTCPCSRFQQPTKCGKSFSNPNRNAPQLQCRDECAIAKRNAKLAEALGISPDRKEKPNVVYSDELVAFAKANIKFLAAVENTLNEFVNSERKTQVLPYTPENRRKFVRELCHLYRTDTQLIDPEPRRSIQIFRRIDTRTPTPLLTTLVNQTAPGSANLGKLADLRSISSRPGTAVSNQPSSSRLVGSSATMNRGWTSVVAAVNQGNVSSSARSTAAETTPKLEITVPKQEDSGKSLNSSVRDNWESD